MKQLSFTPRDGVCFDLHEKTYLNKNKGLFVMKDIPYYRWKWSKLGLFSDQTAKKPCYLSVTPPPHPTPIGWYHEKVLSILLTVLSPVPHDWIPLNPVLSFNSCSKERQFMSSTWREDSRSAAAHKRETDVYGRHVKILYIARIHLYRKKQLSEM